MKIDGFSVDIFKIKDKDEWAAYRAYEPCFCLIRNTKEEAIEVAKISLNKYEKNRKKALT